MVVTATAAMLPASAFSGLALPTALSPLITHTLGAIHTLLPPELLAAGSAAGGALRGMGAAALQWRNTHALAAVLAHGLLTDGVSDALAQALAASPTATANQPDDPTAISLDWRRIRRSTAVAFLSDDLPFALWAKVLWDGFEKLRPAILGASFMPLWLRTALASPLGIAALKTLASQLGYETLSTGAYLGLQEVARGGGVRGVLREWRHKFWRAWTSGLAFFSATHLAMFLVPIWWLQPLIDNLSCLAFNTYLALLSHEHVDADADDHATPNGRATRDQPVSPPPLLPSTPAQRLMRNQPPR